jgi:hypothetical protein
MKHTGPAPFGFAWKDGGLSIVEKEAQVRRLAFDVFAELKNKAVVAKQMNAAGHRTRRGEQWRDVTVHRLLACTSANGIYALNKTSTNAAGERIERPESEWHFVECPRLVPADLWERVQALLSPEASRPPPAKAGSHPFTGLLFCQCGSRMNISSTGLKFACPKCGERIPVRDLEERVLDEITSFLRSRQQLAAEAMCGDRSLAEQRAALREAEKRAGKLDAEISRVQRLIMENRISVKSFEKMHRPLEDERRSANREIGRLEAKLSRVEAKGAAPEHAPTPFDPNALRHRWPTISAKVQREIAHRFLRQIVVAGDELEFTYPFRDSSVRTTKSQHVPGPTSSPSSPTSEQDEAKYIRLPKAGQLCHRTGMTRSALNELILPNERNGYRPPVESISLRKREGGKGIRLILWQSLRDYLAWKT